MNNDLISRSELKKALCEFMKNNIGIYSNEMFHLVDSIPTVERPHGEWNYVQAEMCVCPFCGAIPHKLYKNYCPNCGADMRKKVDTDNLNKSYEYDKNQLPIV